MRRFIVTKLATAPVFTVLKKSKGVKNVLFCYMFIYAYMAHIRATELSL